MGAADGREVGAGGLEVVVVAVDPRRGQGRRVHAVGTGGKHAVLVGDAAPQFLGAPRSIVLLVVLDIEALAQPIDDVVEGGAGHENFRFHVFSGKLFLRLAGCAGGNTKYKVNLRQKERAARSRPSQ